MFSFFFVRFTGEKIKTINLGSYNYLGFANNNGPIVENVINTIKTNGIAASSATQEFGNIEDFFVYLLFIYFRNFKSTSKTRSITFGISWYRRCNGIWYGICN